MSKILVICFSSINNVAMAIPVIHSLATQYAQHQIMVLSIDTFSPLFENVPDNVIFRGADFRGEHAGLMGLGWLYNDLKEEKFDAVAAFLEPEILVVDEVLAVGDAEFQKKAIGKMQDVSKGEG